MSIKFIVQAPADSHHYFDTVVEQAFALVASDTLKEAIAICLKEQMSNARAYSLKLDKTATLTLSIKVTKHHLIAKVIDEGDPWHEDGWLFIHNAEYQMRKLMEDGATSGRGLLITYLLTDGTIFFRGGRERVMLWRLNRKRWRTW